MTMDAEPPIPDEIKSHPAWLRLEDQLNWYGDKSAWNQKWYKRLRITQVVLATAIPFVSIANVAWIKWVTAVFGGLIAILEAIQHLNQLGTLWVQYRSTAEHLKHEKFLFLSESGPYRDLQTEETLRLLAERVEEHVSTEHARWIRSSEKAIKEEKQA